ncbi:MAG: hypothetical protein AAF799_01535 [Myxococcota bacterium]
MASWKLVDVPDSASEYVGEILEDSGKVAKSNLTKEASRINEVADTAKAVIIIQILEAAG